MIRDPCVRCCETSERRSAMRATRRNFNGTTTYFWVSWDGGVSFCSVMASPDVVSAPAAMTGALPSAVMALTMRGFTRVVPASFWTSSRIVAEHSTVLRLRSQSHPPTSILFPSSTALSASFLRPSRPLMIPVMDSSKPSSISLSASSRTSHRHLPTFSDSVFCRWSSRRPGVATMMGRPFLIRAFSCVLVLPPTKSPETSHLVRLPPWPSSASADVPSGRSLSFNNASRTSEICFASSRVGAMMTASVPMERSMYESELRGRRSWRMGRRKESVFPEPVWDWINTSRAAMSGFGSSRLARTER